MSRSPGWDDAVVDRVVGEVVRAAIAGVGPFKGAPELVAPLRRRGMSTGAVVDRLVRTQVTQATLQGAVAGIGGLVTAAVGVLPATAASMFVQARLAAAIAHAHGHDLSDPAVQARVGKVVSGTGVATSSRRAGVEVGERAARAVVPRVQARAAAKVAARTAAGSSGGRIATRAAGVSVGRTVPVVGAVVGGALDLAVTRRVAARARLEFGEPTVVASWSTPPYGGR